MNSILNILIIFLVYKFLNFAWNKLIKKFKKRG